MANYNLPDTFNNAVSAIIDALSYIGEFDKYTFMPSLFTSTKQDSSCKDAGRYANEYLDKAFSLIRVLSKHHPDKEQISAWWKTKETYPKTVNLLKMLDNYVDVIPMAGLLNTPLQDLSISIIASRNGLISFNKRCKKAIAGLNKILNSYNRYADENHKLNRIKLNKKKEECFGQA